MKKFNLRGERWASCREKPCADRAARRSSASAERTPNVPPSQADRSKFDWSSKLVRLGSPIPPELPPPFGARRLDSLAGDGRGLGVGLYLLYFAATIGGSGGIQLGSTINSEMPSGSRVQNIGGTCAANSKAPILISTGRAMPATSGSTST